MENKIFICVCIIEIIVILYVAYMSVPNGDIFELFKDTIRNQIKLIKGEISIEQIEMQNMKKKNTMLVITRDEILKLDELDSNLHLSVIDVNKYVIKIFYDPNLDVGEKNFKKI